MSCANTARERSFETTHKRPSRVPFLIVASFIDYLVMRAGPSLPNPRKRSVRFCAVMTISWSSATFFEVSALAGDHLDAPVNSKAAPDAAANPVTTATLFCRRFDSTMAPGTQREP
jgi:hypothetical protein